MTNDELAHRLLALELEVKELTRLLRRIVKVIERGFDFEPAEHRSTNVH